MFAAATVLFGVFCMSSCGETPSVDLPPVTDAPVPPQTPQEPQLPVVPEQPTEPNVPSEPTTPTEPQEPSTPSEPSEPTEPATPEQPFDVTTAENIAKLETNLQLTIEFLNMRVVGSGTTIKEVKYIYLTKSENSEIVNTIGAVLVGNVSTDSEYLVVGELTIPTTTDITYESICKDGLTFDLGNTSHKKIYSFSVSRSQETQYQEVVDIIEKQTFGEDYQETTEWTGWRCTTGPGNDTHRVVMLKDNKINEIAYWITNDYTTLTLTEAVKKNFWGKEPSEELDYDGSYIIADSQEITIPADALNLKAIKANNQQNG